MNYYNIYLEDIYGEKRYVLAINEAQLSRLVEGFLNGEAFVNVKGVSRKLEENKNFIIYSITSYDMKGKTQEEIESLINKEKNILNKGKVSLGLYKRYGTNITDNFTNGQGFGELKNAGLKPKKIIKKNTSKIFISHSTKNKDVVSKFCDLILDNGLNIDTTTELFNTSLEGSKPKTGDDFKNSIKNALENAKLVLQFISKDYKSSEVCLNEMGAAWVLCDNVFPLIIDENEYDVGFIHNTTQQIQLNNKNQISKLIDDLKDKGIVGDFKIERLNQKIQEFVYWLAQQKEKKEKFQSLSETAKKIFKSESKNPFYKINTHKTIYLEIDGKFHPIPDNYTLFFYGYSEFNKTNDVSFSKLELTQLVGEPISSVLTGAIWVNKEDQSAWLLYNNYRHHIANPETLLELKKASPNMLTLEINTKQLLSCPEDNAFDLRGKI